jgi:hypothetical protein
LNRHIRKYHSETTQEATLADVVRNLKRRRLSLADPRSPNDSERLVNSLTPRRNTLAESTKPKTEISKSKGLETLGVSAAKETEPPAEEKRAKKEVSITSRKLQGSVLTS